LEIYLATPRVNNHLSSLLGFDIAVTKTILLELFIISTSLKKSLSSTKFKLANFLTKLNSLKPPAGIGKMFFKFGGYKRISNFLISTLLNRHLKY